MNTPTEGQLIEIEYGEKWFLRHCLAFIDGHAIVRYDHLEPVIVRTPNRWRWPAEKVKVKQSDLIAHYCKSLDLDPQNIEIV